MKRETKCKVRKVKKKGSEDKKETSIRNSRRRRRSLERKRSRPRERERESQP